MSRCYSQIATHRQNPCAPTLLAHVWQINVNSLGQAAVIVKPHFCSQTLAEQYELCVNDIISRQSWADWRWKFWEVKWCKCFFVSSLIFSLLELYDPVIVCWMAIITKLRGWLFVMWHKIAVRLTGWPHSFTRNAWIFKTSVHTTLCLIHFHGLRRIKRFADLMSDLQAAWLAKNHLESSFEKVMLRNQRVQRPTKRVTRDHPLNLMRTLIPSHYLHVWGEKV